MNSRHLTVILAAVLTAATTGNTAWAQSYPLVKQIAVSDSSDRDVVNADISFGPLADVGDIVVRERLNLTQDDRQIRTFLEFDLSSLTAADVADPDFVASFSVDFVTRLNDVNDMSVRVGRVLDGDSWSLETGELPVFDWARPGDEVGEDLAANSALLVGNAKTDEFGVYRANVTTIVTDWVNGTHENNGFVLFGGSDAFQGAGFRNATLGVPEPSSFGLFAFGFLALVWRRRRSC